MSYNTILATAPLTTQNYHLKMIGSSIGNSLIWDNGTNVGIGNTNTSYTLDVSGTGRFTSDLLVVRNATMSSYVANVTGTAGAGVGSQFLLQDGGTNVAWFRRNRDGAGVTELANVDGTFIIKTGATAAINALTIASTGAATFSSTLAATGTISYTGTSNAFAATNGNTGYIYQYMGNTGNTTYFGIERSTGGGLMTGSSAYAVVLSSNTAAVNLEFGTSGTKRLTLDGSTGAATFTSTMNINGPSNDPDIALNVAAPSGSGKYVMFGRNSSNVAVYSLSSAGAISASSSITTTNGGAAQEAAFRATMSYADGYRAILYLNNTHTGGKEYYIASTNNSDGIWGGGKLAISGNNGTNGVYLNGVTATTWTGQSDIRLKDIDSEIENAIDKVNKLRGVRFTWKSDETKKMQVGLIAQEVKEVLPEAVDFDETNEDYRMGVQYTDLIPLLVNAIKEMNNTITSLQEQINELKNK